MDTKTIIETANTKLVELTEICKGINDNLEVFVSTLRDMLDNVTAIYAQCAAWSVDDFIMLPVALKEAGFGQDVIVALTDVYYQNRAANASTPSPVIAALTAGADYWMKQLVDALQQQESSDDLSNYKLTEAGIWTLLKGLASEGDNKAIDLLRRNSESVTANAEPVNKKDDEGKNNA